jgi:hypothetical protein
LRAEAKVLVAAGLALVLPADACSAGFVSVKQVWGGDIVD